MLPPAITLSGKLGDPPASRSLAVAAVEADNQPAEVGFRLTKVNALTGQIEKSTIAVRSIKEANNKILAVSEPRLQFLPGTDTLVATYGRSYATRNNNNNDGHSGGAKISAVSMFKGSDLSAIGTEMSRDKSR